MQRAEEYSVQNSILFFSGPDNGHRLQPGWKFAQLKTKTLLCLLLISEHTVCCVHLHCTTHWAQQYSRLATSTQKKEKEEKSQRTEN